jgi:hypothetical protein
MLRAERAATALPTGSKILETLNKERPKLIAAAKLSRPPVASVSKILLEKHGAEIMETPVRQFIGLSIRAILEEEGFEIAHTGVRINGDPVFRTGAVYRQKDSAGLDNATDEIFNRLIKVLTLEEAKSAFRALVREFPQLQEVKKSGRNTK